MLTESVASQAPSLPTIISAAAASKIGRAAHQEPRTFRIRLAVPEAMLAVRRLERLAHGKQVDR